jgi:hypothetical protein
MKKYFLFLSIGFLAAVKGFACSCFPIGNHFCETLANDSSIATVVMVQKLNDYHYGMRVRLLQHISGEPMADTVMVWGDNGALCRLYTGGWNNGDTLILALHHSDLLGNTIYNPDYPPNLENIQDYHISGCGVYALNVNLGQVTGYINQNNTQWMSISSFLAQPCIYVLHTENPDNELEATLYPNPASNLVYISVNNQVAQTFRISIINALGEIVDQYLYQPGTPINLGQLKNGLYTVIISSPSQKKCFRVVKQA